MPDNKVIPLFGEKTPDHIFISAKDLSLGGALNKQNGRTPGGMDDAFEIIRENPERLRLTPKMLAVSEILETSILGTLVDFSSELGRFAIIFYGSWERKEGSPRLTQEEVNKILSCSPPFDEETSKLLLYSLAFSEIVLPIKHDVFPFSPSPFDPVKDDEDRVETLNKFELACYQVINPYGPYGNNKAPEKFLVEELLDRNIKRRIVNGLDRSESPYINKDAYNKAQSLLSKGNDVKLALRRNGFVVVKRNI